MNMMKKFFLAACLLTVLMQPQLVFAESITMNVGSSTVMYLKGVSDIKVGNPAVAAGRVISENEVLVEGKTKGSTEIVFMTDKGPLTYPVIVGSVNNPGSSMIEIDAQIMEVIDKNGSNVGIDWNTLLGKSAAASSGGNPILAALNVKENDPGLLFFGKFSRGAINVILDFLVNENKAKVLAKPKLITLSGQNADFLSGGEIPVPINGDDGKVTVDWKSYGVGLNITPSIEKNGNIRALIKVEVSNVDYGNAIKINDSGSVPAMRTRRASSTISVGSDETIVIAGLLNTEKSTVTTGVPVLSWIPFLGELFKNTSNIETTTELVIFVTPHLVNQ